MQRILVVYGTRPEAIKMAPVVKVLDSSPDDFKVTVCSTGQHRQMLDQVQKIFGLRADIDLQLMKPNQNLNSLSSLAIQGIDAVVKELRPDWILVQGDTTTAMVAAIVGFHRRVRVGHIEAGLRTGDLDHPFPEEANRRIVDIISAALFAPTNRSRDQLIAEGADEDRVFLTGNTVVDALMIVSRSMGPIALKEQVLITVHRRESFGQAVRNIFLGLKILAKEFPRIRWLYPVHRNPNILNPARRLLAGIPNLELCEPLDYDEMVRQMRASRLILTDSGGIQEEAPAFGKPVLVLRETTERPEGIAAGTAKLIGTDTEMIVQEVRKLITDEVAYRKMAQAVNPYGDGLASSRIAAILRGESASMFRPQE